MTSILQRQQRARKLEFAAQWAETANFLRTRHNCLCMPQMGPELAYVIVYRGKPKMRVVIQHDGIKGVFPEGPHFLLPDHDTLTHLLKNSQHNGSLWLWSMLCDTLGGMQIVGKHAIQYRHIRIVFERKSRAERQANPRQRNTYYVHAYDCCFVFHEFDSMLVNVVRDRFEEAL